MVRSIGQVVYIGPGGGWGGRKKLGEGGENDGGGKETSSLRTASYYR